MAQNPPAPATAVTCVVIDKPRPSLDPSETFIRAHVDGLAGRVVSLVGAPLRRYTELGSGPPLDGQSQAAKGVRWVARHSGFTTVARQDLSSLSAYLRRERVEVVLAEYGVSALLIAETCRSLGIPLVTHFHGWDAYVLASDPGTREAYQALFRDSTVVIAVSRHMRRHLISLGVPAERLVVNSCGADLAPTAARPQEAPPRFLSIGRPAPKKATSVTLLAFAALRKQVPEARLDLVGANLDWITGQLVRALRIQDAVTLHGALPHAEVLRLVQQMRAYVHPSVVAPDGDMEGTPVSVLEAMAAGVPVIGTRHGGILDVLEGTSAGILVDEFDVEATAQAMKVYAEDPARAARDGAAARERLAHGWTMQGSLAKLREIVECARKKDTARIRELAEATA